MLHTYLTVSAVQVRQDDVDIPSHVVGIERGERALAPLSCSS
jgi:hypothetical protein